MIRTLRIAVIAALILSASGSALAAGPKKPVAKHPTVVIKTSLGAFKAELYEDKAPLTVKNFLRYVDEKFYDDTIFHRVINGFMIQGGGFDKALKEKTVHEPIKNEAGNGLKNETGTLAMARTSVPDSATAQFFVNVKDNEFLNYQNPTPEKIGYCVFGKVTSGIDVVNKIKEAKTSQKNGMDDVPVEAIVIQSIRRG